MFCWSQTKGMSSALYPQPVDDDMFYPEDLEPSPGKRSGRMSYPMSGYTGTGHQGHLPFNSWAGKRTPEDYDVEEMAALQKYLNSLRY